MKRTLIVLLPLIALCSCKHMVDEMKDMKALNKSIDSQFHLKNTALKIANSENLQVQIINSPYKDSSDDARQRLADSIGILAVSRLQTVKLTGGAVLFVQETNGGMLSMSKSDGYQMHIKPKP